jgi:predicted metal-dependent HD superfamily phosphohydrolase
MSDIEQWVDTWRDLSVADSPTLRQLYADVRARYAESHRHYHTHQHLAECFEKVQDIIVLAPHPAEVKLALWFHDAVYDTRRHDNEQRSAEWARGAAQDLGARAEIAERIYDLIMSTRHAAEPVGPDAQVLVDVDLSILGAEAGRFREYEMQVRREYSWVPDDTFRLGRAKILKDFLGRPQIYSTARFRERYEAPARRNLRDSLERLTCPMP